MKGLDELLGDPETQRCLRVFSGEEWTLDDLIEGCYGSANERPPDALIAVPEDLVRSIERTYAEVSRHGFLTERDVEERLYAWLSRESGA